LPGYQVTQRIQDLENHGYDPTGTPKVGEAGCGQTLHEEKDAIKWATERYLKNLAQEVIGVSLNPLRIL
jgi:hypothetical protein